LWDNGLKVFSSSKFHHGETVAEVDGNYYTISHNKIYKTDQAGTITHDEDHHATNIAPLDFSITKGVVSIMFTVLLMFFLFKSLADSYSKNGGIASGAGRFFEPIVLYIRDDIAIPNIGEKHYRKYMSFLLTVFFFVWFLNILGLTPLGINVTGNIAVTFCLALLTFLLTNLTGTKDYWLHIFDPLGNTMKWYAKIPLYIILIPIEVLGIFIKPFSLLIRLYANMQAGHIVLMSLIGLMFIFKSWLGSPLSFGLAFAISLIEVLVALLQAYIFTMLSALYFGFASEEHEHHNEIETH
jgi:F-type H+-transporting ATPase subunit a